MSIYESIVVSFRLASYAERPHVVDILAQGHARPSPDVVEGWLRDGSGVYVGLATVGGSRSFDIVGVYALNTRVPSPWAKVIAFGVDRACRRKDVGTQMLASIDNVAARAGRLGLQIEVPEFADDMVSFLAARGKPRSLRAVGIRRRRAPKCDLYVFRREIDDAGPPVQLMSSDLSWVDYAAAE